ncbi:MAG: amidohydrolase family protein [Flammeovirgaceae bacterium]
MRQAVLFIFFLLAFSSLHAQDHFPLNGITDNRSNSYALTNATIYVDHQTKLEKASLLIKDGKVVEVGINVTIPSEYTQLDLNGRFIYPSFIDLHSTYGMPEVKRPGFNWGSSEKITPLTKGAYNANDAIKSAFNASESFQASKKTAKSMRGLGFGTVLTFRPDGLARGTGAVVTLADDVENKVILNGKASAHYSFSKGSSEQNYPISYMGFVAVLRQTHYDAQWYQTAKNENFFDHTLEAYHANAKLPQFFDAGNWQDVLRADKIGDELGKQYIIRTKTDTYRRIKALKGTGATLIVPINFPKAYKVEDPFDARNVTLAQMKHWELAPTNLARLAEAGIAFCITAADLKSKAAFLPNLRKAIKNGLSEEDALKALTSTPAKLIHVSDQVGSLKKGMIANFIVTSGNIFEDKSKIHHNWIQGKPYVIKAIDDSKYNGLYTLNIGETSHNLEINGKAGAPAFKIVVNDSTTTKVKGSIKDGLITLSFKAKKDDPASIRLSGWFNGANELTKYGFKGKAELLDGSMVDWNANFQKELAEKEKDDKSAEKEEEKPEVGDLIYPFTAFGSTEIPQQEDFIIKNATVWTNEKDGVLQNADVIVKGGKISRVGKNLSGNGLTVIDGTGKHLTSGIIDEHSHIALRSVNDVDVVSSQVRMEDVVDSEDIDIYRQLAGGVTAAQLLHGSANPVGGQSALVKLKWGVSPNEMLIPGADQYIKFALGENVKRSRSSNSIRFPQTRMGVEQIYIDYFTQAKEYDAKWKAYNKLSASAKANTPAPRRDLQLEAMAEILNNKRFITCHSYVQSEINMLMKVAEQFGFTVNTFTHILEGYKVADKMKEHGAGASTFADWWAYKYEVKDAIPFNPTLMHNEGVVVAINSDDAEMGRRLNHEAAKSIKYGGMSEEDAWKMVTLNPAKLLHLDQQMGSIKSGKDADLVLWSDNPLSIYAKAEKTFIDGIAYYDAEKDKALQAYIQKERARLIQKMLDKGGKGSSKGWQTPKPKYKKQFHCDDLENRQ